VSAAISSEPALTAEPASKVKKRWAGSWWHPLASAAAVAGVATVSILWMRSQVGPESIPAVVQTVPPAAATPVINTSATTPEPDSYVVPKTPGRRLIVPSTELANYVVAHSEVSSPMARRNLLSAFMASESGTAGTSAGSEEPIEDVQDDEKNPQ
jgi:hypothetical protein